MAGEITIVGLGAGEFNNLPRNNQEALKNSTILVLKTKTHPSVKGIKERGAIFTTFDHLFTSNKTLQEIYQEINFQLVDMAQKEAVVYAVPGNPIIFEGALNHLLGLTNQKLINVRILPSKSILEGLYTKYLNIDPSEGILIIDAFTLTKDKLNPEVGTVITHIYNSDIASKVKACVKEQNIDGKRILYCEELGIMYIPPLTGDELYRAKPVQALINVMDILRSEAGCPWDREQTHQSLKKYLIEETYEVLDAIDSGNMNKICEELGDLLLQAVFHAQIAKEQGYFNFNDISYEIVAKMIRRHPHVFSNVNVKDAEEVLINWDKIKKQEQKDSKQEEKYLLDQVPKSFPGLLRATKLQAKAAKVGFDWPTYEGALDKIYEELDEVKAEIGKPQLESESLKGEIGDLLFAVVNLARFLKVDCEEALSITNQKFTNRFNFIEDRIRAQSKEFSDYSLVELDEIWEKSKKRV